MFTRRENIYYGVIGTLGVGILFYFTYFTKQYKDFNILLFIMFVIGCIILEKTSIKIGEFTLTLDTALMLATYFILGLIPVLWLVSIVLFVSDGFILMRPKRKIYYFIGMFILIFTISHFIFQLTGYKVTLGTVEGIIKSVVFGIVVFLINWVFLLIQFAVYLKGRIPEGMKETFIWDCYGNFVVIPISVLLAEVYFHSGYLGTTFLLIIVVSANLLFRLFRNLIFMNHELKVVQEVSASISSRLNLNDTTAGILKGINELVNCDYSAILKFNTSNHSVETIDYRYEDDIFFDTSLVDKVMTENMEDALKIKKSFIIEDAKRNKLLEEIIDNKWTLPQEVGSIIYEPLFLEDETIGCLVILSSIRNKFQKEQLQILDILSNQAVIAIENARLYKEAHNKAIRDGLTGLYNQRHFYDILESITNNCRNCIREQCIGCNITSLIILDLDHFKIINDTYGHQTGDKILKEVSTIISENVRKNDSVARYGGEEFTVILPHTSQENAYEIADRIREAVESCVFYSTNRDRIRLTISGGVSEFPSSADSSTNLLAYADRAMYSGSKKQGRNKISIYVN